MSAIYIEMSLSIKRRIILPFEVCFSATAYWLSDYQNYSFSLMAYTVKTLFIDR